MRHGEQTLFTDEEAQWFEYRRRFLNHRAACQCRFCGRWLPLASFRKGLACPTRSSEADGARRACLPRLPVDGATEMRFLADRVRARSKESGSAIRVYRHGFAFLEDDRTLIAAAYSPACVGKLLALHGKPLGRLGKYTVLAFQAKMLDPVVDVLHPSATRRSRGVSRSSVSPPRDAD